MAMEADFTRHAAQPHYAYAGARFGNIDAVIPASYIEYYFGVTDVEGDAFCWFDCARFDRVLLTARSASAARRAELPKPGDGDRAQSVR